MVRGPGGTEPFLILQGIKSGKTFEQSLADVEKASGFHCEQWWIDLNRDAMLEAASEKPKAEAAKAKGKG